MLSTMVHTSLGCSLHSGMRSKTRNRGLCCIRPLAIMVMLVQQRKGWEADCCRAAFI